jgi:MbtH protein
MDSDMKFVSSFAHERSYAAGVTGGSLYVAVRSCHGHHSLWPAGREIPSGWSQIGEAGSREECLDLIEATWEDAVLGFRPATGD